MKQIVLALVLAAISMTSFAGPLTEFSNPAAHGPGTTLITFDECCPVSSEPIGSLGGVTFSLLTQGTMTANGFAPTFSGAPQSTYAREFPPYNGPFFLNTIAGIGAPFDSDLLVMLPSAVTAISAEIRSDMALNNDVDDLLFELYDGNTPVGSLTRGIRGQDNFFFYGLASETPFDRWVIRQTPDTRFALENLRFGSVAKVPEPSVLSLLVVSAIPLLWSRRSRRLRMLD